MQVEVEHGSARSSHGRQAFLARWHAAALTLLPPVASITLPLFGEELAVTRITAYDVMILLWLCHYLALGAVAPRSASGRKIQRFLPAGGLLTAWILLGLLRPAPFVIALTYAGGAAIGFATVLVIACEARSASRQRAVHRALVQGWCLAAVLQALAAVLGSSATARSAGLHRFPNELAVFSLATLAVLGAPSSLRLGRSTPRTVVGVVAALTTLLFSGGRAAYVGALILLGGWPVYMLRRRPVLALVAALSLLTATSLVFQLASVKQPLSEERIASTGQQVLQRSLPNFVGDNWHAGVELFLSSPGSTLLGAGFGNATVESKFLPGLFQIHNTYIAVAAATGLAGVILLCAGIRLLSRSLSRRRPSMYELIVLVSVAAASAFSYNLNSRSLWLLFATLAISSSDREIM